MDDAIFDDRETALRTVRVELNDPALPAAEETGEDGSDGTPIPSTAQHGMPPHVHGRQCWCEPEVEQHPNGTLVIHHEVKGS